MQARRMLCAIATCGLLVYQAKAEETPPQWYKDRVWAKPPFVNQDVRLERLVSVQSQRMTVSDVLASISNESGVNMEADRELGKLNVFVRIKQRTVGHTLEALALTLDAGWQVVEKGGNQPYEYRLIKDNKQHLGYWERKFRELVRDLISGLSSSRGELEKQLVNNPLLVVHLIPPLRKGVETLSFVSTEQLHEVLDRGIRLFPKHQMLPQLRDVFDEMVERAHNDEIGGRAGITREEWRGLFIARHRYGFAISLYTSTLAGFSGSFNVPSLKPPYALAKELLEKAGLNVSPYEARWERVGRKVPLELLERYKVEDVLSVLAEHFDVDIVARFTGRVARLYPAVRNAETAYKALGAVCRDFNLMKRSMIWHLFSLKPLSEVDSADE